MALGRALGLSSEYIVTLGWAGPGHDLGKLVVPQRIPDKNGSLSADERLLVQLHPRISSRTMEEVVRPGELSAMVYHHHERYDGSGYPDSLKWQEIPLGARILAVAGVFEAHCPPPLRQSLDQERSCCPHHQGLGKPL